jgi:hypothetical protein
VSVEISHVNKLSSRQYGPIFRRMLGCIKRKGLRA